MPSREQHSSEQRISQVRCGSLLFLSQHHKAQRAHFRCVAGGQVVGPVAKAAVATCGGLAHAGAFYPIAG
jgi:hypothetical protein